MPINDYQILLDLPAAQPALGFEETAIALASIIEKSSPRFAIGIFGSWGAGKTTLMQRIDAKLNSGDLVKVEFSAWRYEKEEHLIVPLLDCVRDALISWSESHKSLRRKRLRRQAPLGRPLTHFFTGST